MRTLRPTLKPPWATSMARRWMTGLSNARRVSSQHEEQLIEFQPATTGAPEMLGQPGIARRVSAWSVGEGGWEGDWWIWGEEGGVD